VWYNPATLRSGKKNLYSLTHKDIFDGVRQIMIGGTHFGGNFNYSYWFNNLYYGNFSRTTYSSGGSSLGQFTANQSILGHRQPRTYRVLDKPL